MRWDVVFVAPNVSPRRRRRLRLEMGRCDKLPPAKVSSRFVGSIADGRGSIRLLLGCGTESTGWMIAVS